MHAYLPIMYFLFYKSIYSNTSMIIHFLSIEDLYTIFLCLIYAFIFNKVGIRIYAHAYLKILHIPVYYGIENSIIQPVLRNLYVPKTMKGYMSSHTSLQQIL
jgi:hypothetical protein